MKRTASASLLLLALLGLSGCKDKDEASGQFDTDDPKNRPARVFFGRKAEASLTLEALDLLRRPRLSGPMCPVGPAGSDPLGDLRRWGRFFDGSAERPRFNEDHIHAVMASEGVSHGIVDSVIEESRRQGADPVLVLSVMKKESSFNPKARSNKGARGLMQVMPATGRTYGVKSPSKLYDPNTNIRVGVAFLKNTFDEFSSAGMQALAAVNPFSDSGVKAAIAAYNAGEGSVRKFKGVPPFRETRKFVAKVLEFYADYRGKLEALAEDSGGL